jgi:hypothetical protein
MVTKATLVGKGMLTIEINNKEAMEATKGDIIKVAVIGVVINREVVVIGEVTSREEEEVVVPGTSNNNMGVEETQ